MITKSQRRTLKLYQAGSARLAADFWHQLLLHSNNPLACQQGCADCCYQPLTMTLLNGILVYEWLASNNLWTRSLKERFKETAERTTNLALEVWMLSMIPCPLLDTESKSCRAYKGRPFICKIAFSYNAHFCHPHRFLEALQGPQYEPRRETLKELAAMEERLLKKHRLARVVLPFAAAVLHGEAICTTDEEYNDRTRLIWLKQLKGD